MWPFDGHAFLDSFEDLWSHLSADCVDAARTLLGGAERAYQQIARLPVQLSEFFSRFDVVLSAVVSAPPPLLGTYGPTVPTEQLMSTMFDWVAYTPLQNMAGTPAISLPLFQSSEGLPIGSMFAADRSQEDVLLALAFELEAALPWAERWPKHSIATLNS